MIRFFSLLVSVFIFFSSIHISAHENNNFNPKHYVYDDEGRPLFVKVYMEVLKAIPSNRSRDAVPLLLREEGIQVLNLMRQEDQQGSFLVIPIKKKKKDRDDDQDEDTWECPLCGEMNLAYRNTCMNSDCPLNRKGIREKLSFFSLTNCITNLLFSSKSS